MPQLPLEELVKTAELTSCDRVMTAAAAGYDLTDGEDRLRSVEDLSLLFFRLARTIGIDLFIEAGAKDGSTSRRARRKLDPRRVVAFEANPYTYERFRRQHEDEIQPVEYLHLALSDGPNEVSFRVLQRDDGRPRADGQSSLLARSADLGAGSIEVTVPATTLDSFFADHDYERSALWIDVEGAMEPVLKGGVNTCSRAALVIAEVEDREYWSGQWLRADLVSYLYDRGLLPVARDFQSRYQYNILFLARELAENDRVRLQLAQQASAVAGRRTERAAARIAAQTSAALATTNTSSSRWPRKIGSRAIRTVRGRYRRRAR